MNDTPSFDADAFRRFEHDGWTEVAARYNDSFGVLTGQSVEAVLDAADVGPDKGMLDLACGTGKHAVAAVARGARVNGLDLSEAMVAQAKASCPGADIDVGDAQDLPYEEKSFDAVVCGFGLLHFPDAHAAVAEVARILRPGGRFVCSCWRPAEQSPYLAILRDAMAEFGSMDVSLPQGPPAYQYGEPDRLKTLLGASGLSVLRVFEVPILVRMRNEADVLTALLEGGVRSRKLLEAQTPQALEKITEFAMERARAFRTGEWIEIPRPALIGVALRP